jgi:hypothetical protein
MNAPSVTADAAGTWRLGDLTVNRLGFGAMRLTGDLSGDGTPRDRGQSPVGEHFAALAALRDAGLVRHLGLSNVTVGQIDEALEIAPVAAVQNRYSIDSRRPEADDVLRACAQRDARAGPAGLDTGAGEPRAGDSRNQQPRAPGRERSRRRAGPHGRRPGHPRLPGLSLATRPRPAYCTADRRTGRLADRRTGGGTVQDPCRRSLRRGVRWRYGRRQRR